MSKKELLAVAKKARENSHSPYSERKVGAAIRTSDGKIFGGCNIENSSFGGTVCAERVAIWKAVSELGPGTRVAEVLVVTDVNPPWTPCGFCRQVIAEFVASADAPIHTSDLSGSGATYKFSELLPEAFTPAQMFNS